MNIRFDSAGRLLGGQGLFPPPKFWSFDLGYFSAGEVRYTDVIDLGEGHSYTFLVARRIGNPQKFQEIEIHSSIDRARWAPAAGPYYGIARYDSWLSELVSFCVWGRPIGRYVRIYYRNAVSVSVNNVVIQLVAFSGI